MERWRKLKIVCKTEILQLPISRGEERKVKYIELNYWRCELAGTRQTK